ncbi:hypothetical protein T11_9359, partial [Trichinella zimbabwensis]
SSCDALFICSKGATQGQRHRARRRTESSEEPVGTWKYHKTTNQQRRRYSLSSSQDSQGVVHNVNTVADLVGAGRNLVMGQGPSGKESDFKYFFRTNDLWIDCGCDRNNAKVEFPFLSEEVCGIEGTVTFLCGKVGPTVHKTLRLLGSKLSSWRQKKSTVEWTHSMKTMNFCEITIHARALISAGQTKAADSQNAMTADGEKNDSIHKRVDLSDGAKLTYLRGCLTGGSSKAEGTFRMALCRGQKGGVRLADCLTRLLLIQRMTEIRRKVKNPSPLDSFAGSPGDCSWHQRQEDDS